MTRLLPISLSRLPTRLEQERGPQVQHVLLTFQSDGVFLYACVVLYNGLLVLELRDASIKEMTLVSRIAGSSCSSTSEVQPSQVCSGSFPSDGIHQWYDITSCSNVSQKAGEDRGRVRPAEAVSKGIKQGKQTHKAVRQKAWGTNRFKSRTIHDCWTDGDCFVGQVSDLSWAILLGDVSWAILSTWK